MPDRSEAVDSTVPARFRTVLLDRSHDRNAFMCGEATLDRYLHQQAGQDATRRLAVTYVLPDADDATRLLGYYSLIAFAVESTDLPLEITRRLPRYPHLPAILLGRLAVASDAQGRGLGTTLLLDALARIWTQSTELGCHLAVVDALHARAAAFYAQFGFVPFPDHSARLFLPVATIDRLWRGIEPG